MLRSGDTIHFNTPDPKTMPLPHPAMFQLHAMVSRIMAKKSAAGYPVMPPDERNGNTEAGLVGGGDGLTEGLTHGGGDGNYTGHGSVPVVDGKVGKAERTETQRVLHRPARLGFVSPPSSIVSQPASPRFEGQEVKQQPAPDKPRLVDSVNAEYSVRMTEMYEKMGEMLGREVDGDMWWTKEGGS